jgi:SAM-dependent methyltransferase
LSEWWETFFDEHYLRAGLARIKRAKTLADVRFIRRTLGLRRGSKILDVCCGAGRHSLELAKLGHRVTGVDLSHRYLEIAAAKARRRGIRVRFQVADVRNLRFGAEFDAAICMWTSFGYFQDESDNLKVLRGIHRSLKPGGKFLMEVINRDWLVVNFEPLGWTRLDGGYLLEKRQMDFRQSRIIGEWTYVGAQGKIQRYMNLRIYSVHELAGLLMGAGFRLEAFFGSREQGTPTHEHRMTAVLAAK